MNAVQNVINQEAIIRKTITGTIEEIFCPRVSVRLVSGGRLRLAKIFVPWAGSSNWGDQPVLKPIWRREEVRIGDLYFWQGTPFWTRSGEKHHYANIAERCSPLRESANSAGV